MHFFTLAVFALLAVQQSASARLKRNKFRRIPHEDNETFVLAPPSDEDGEYPLLWRKITAVGRTVDEHIDNFNKELAAYLDMPHWNFEDGAFFDDSELVEELGLNLPERWPNSTRAPNFLEVGSISTAWDETPKTEFVPEKWQPLVADVGHFVGSGTFGNVYVINTAMGRRADRDSTVAMKVEKEPGKSIKASEVLLGKTFDHPNVVKVWGVGKFKKHLVMLMESLPGGDLEEAYEIVGKRGEEGRKSVVRAMLEMFVALYYLHSSGSVHSDFKPAQVVLSKKKNGIAKLGDFGLGCANGVSGVVGTPIFMSPELLLNNERTYSVDMWAMGISLYTLFFNDELPPSLRGGGGIKKLYERIMNLDSNFVLHPSGTPLDNLIKGLLTVKVSKRFDAKVALEHAQVWAKWEGLALSDIDAIVKADLAGKRDALPAAWDKCVKLSCKDEPCKEIRENPIEVQCGRLREAEDQYAMSNFNDELQPEREEFIQRLRPEVLPLEERAERQDCSAVAGAIPQESAWRKRGINCKCPEHHKVWCGRVEIARRKFKLGDVANCGFGLSCSIDAPY